MRDQIEAAFAAIRTEIKVAEQAAERPEGAVTLVAVSKTQPVAAIEAALGCGQRVFGENRVQEAASKFPDLRAAWPDLRLHLIGPLQTNKLRQAIGLFDVIETLDRESLAVALAAERARGATLPALFIQVNTGEEPQKAGILPADADAFIERCRVVHGLEIAGAMCIPPVDQRPAPHFALLADLAARHGLKTLSMGMSGDFATAIRFGATHVRIGTALFGRRTTSLPSPS